MRKMKNTITCLLLFFFVFASSADAQGHNQEGELSGPIDISKSSNATHPHLKGEGNYFVMTIYYHKGPGTLTVKNSWLKWGKWVKGPGRKNLHDEVKSPNGLAMTAWGEYHIQATGRENSPSGTQGSFDIYYSDGTRVLYIYFETVWLGRSSWKYELFDKRFKVTATRLGDSYLEITLVIQWAQDKVAEA